MRIVQTYSHLNGLEFLQVHEPDAWKELISVIEGVESDHCKTNSTEKRKDGKAFYARSAMSRCMREGLKAFGWLEHRANYRVKNRVAVEVQFGKYALAAYDLFVKHLAFYVGDVIDVGIEILPMKELQSQMASGPAYYEGELYNLIREGRGVPGVPLILIGISV